MGALAPVVGDAAGAAGAAEGAGQLGTLLSAGGSIASGIGGFQQGMFAAKIARENARQALNAGQNAESTSKMRYGALEAEQTAGYAANGVSVDSGSAQAVKSSTERISALDAALIHFNAAREAYGENFQASLDKRAAVGSLFKGLAGGADSFLGGAQSLSSKASTFKYLSDPASGGTP